MNPCPLRIHASGRALAQQAEILATLPSRYRLADRGSADVLLLSCLDDPAALSPGADVRGLFLTDIAGGTPELLARLQDDLRPFPLTIASHCARALTADQAAALRVDDAAPVILEGRSTSQGPGELGLREAALEGLTLMDVLHGPLVAVSCAERTDDRLVLDVRLTDTVEARLVCARGAPSVRLAAVRPDHRYDLRVAPVTQARAASVVFHNATGSHRLTGRFEGGWRRDWLALADAVSVITAPSVTNWITRIVHLNEALR